tara:strand:- start:60 stop:878 length:819 start_codon:yes stop_codon:yes gene_type:complete
MALKKLLKFAKNVSERAERKARRKPKTRTAEGGTGSAFSGSAADLKKKVGAGNPNLLDASKRAQVKKRRVAEQKRKAGERAEARSKKVAGAAAIGTGSATAGYVAGKSSQGDKPKPKKRPNPRKTKKSELQVELKKRESKRGKVTGKKDTKADRNVTLKSGKKVANVTREQLTKLGLDPNKKSSLTKYLNAYDRLGRRPKTKADLAVKKNMGGMMRSKGSAKGGMMGGKMPQGMMKGGAVGGKNKKPKGYSRGGAVKRRGVGAAQRGFGKAM